MKYYAIIYLYKMTIIKTIIICGGTMMLYDFYKNNPNNKYVGIVKKHMQLCPFIQKIIK